MKKIIRLGKNFERESVVKTNDLKKLISLANRYWGVLTEIKLDFGANAGGGIENLLWEHAEEVGNFVNRFEELVEKEYNIDDDFYKDW